jgi:hypothetical protein
MQLIHLFAADSFTISKDHSQSFITTENKEKGKPRTCTDRALCDPRAEASARRQDLARSASTAQASVWISSASPPPGRRWLAVAPWTSGRRRGTSPCRLPRRPAAACGPGMASSGRTEAGTGQGPPPTLSALTRPPCRCLRHAVNPSVGLGLERTCVGFGMGCCALDWLEVGYLLGSSERHWWMGRSCCWWGRAPRSLYSLAAQMIPRRRWRILHTANCRPQSILFRDGGLFFILFYFSSMTRAREFLVILHNINFIRWGDFLLLEWTYYQGSIVFFYRCVHRMHCRCWHAELLIWSYQQDDWSVTSLELNLGPNWLVFHQAFWRNYIRETWFSGS